MIMNYHMSANMAVHDFNISQKKGQSQNGTQITLFLLFYDGPFEISVF